jgi:hypothetical protein
MTTLRRGGQARVASVVTPVVSMPIARCNWFSTARAAALLHTSERTLRRRLSRDSWIEGFHYRWIVRSTRRTIEVHVPRAIELMEQQGWS